MTQRREKRVKILMTIKKMKKSMGKDKLKK